MKAKLKAVSGILALLAIVAYLAFWHYYVKPMSSDDDWFPYETLVITLTTLLFFSVFFGLLFAFIPAKGTNYRGRLLTALFAGAIFSSALFGWTKWISGPHYYYIKAAGSCGTIKTGHFRVSGNMDIVRTDDRQTQTDLKTGKKEEFRVLWLSECEYRLINKAGRSIRFKVILADSAGYECIGSTLGYTGRSIRVEKVADRQ